MAFYYDQNKDGHSQWLTYLQNQAYVDDITKSIDVSTKKQTKDYSEIISRQTSEFNEAIRSASKEQVLSIQESTEAVCGTLDAGFDLLYNNLQDISYGIEGLSSEINHLSSLLDWKMSLLIEGQKISNILSGNIAILLRIPDIQKERHDYVEKGMKYLRNAIFDNDLYANSLKYLSKAEEKEPEDFFVLHRIGMIYMYSPVHLDLPKAEKYFKLAAKYAIVETNSGATITTNFLNGDVGKNLLSQNPTTDDLKLQAAEAYLFAGRCCYLQGKFKEAAELAGIAFNIVPQMVEAGFTQAKALAANNDDSDAASVLEIVINRDRLYSWKTSLDLDLVTKGPVKNILEKLRQEAFQKASEKLYLCKSKILSTSQGIELLNNIEHYTNQKTYLACKKAIDMFNTTKSYNFKSTVEKNTQNKWVPTIKPNTFSFNIEELIDYELFINKNLKIVKELCSKLVTRSSLREQLKNLQSQRNNTQSVLTSKEKRTKNTGLAVVGGISAFLLGIYLMSTNWHHDLSVGEWFLGMFGFIIFIIGLVVGGPAILLFIGVSGSLAMSSHSRELQGLDAEIKRLNDRIVILDRDITRLESI